MGEDDKQFTQSDMDQKTGKARAEGRASRQAEIDALNEKYAGFDDMKKELDALKLAGKSENEKILAALDKSNKALEAANKKVGELEAFKSKAELQDLKKARCTSGNYPDWYAERVSGSNAEEIDADLKALHAKAGAKNIGAGGGVPGGTSGGNDPNKEIDIQIADLEKQRNEAQKNRDYMETERLSQQIVSLRLNKVRGRGG